MNNFTLQSTSCISYLGISDDEITSELIQLAESYFENTDVSGNITKRVPLIIAESYQNIIRHGNQLNSELGLGVEKDFFQIYFMPDRVVICAVNKINKKHVSYLNKKIDSVNTLSKEELKALWRTTLSDGKVSSKGGAGLGLIEMARKSDMPIQKNFVDLDQDRALFFLGIEIIKKTVTTEPNFNILESELQYNKFVEKGIILEYIGPFNSATNTPLIGILENNLQSEGKMDSDAAENLSMIIEIMQNASKHGLKINDESKGVFTIYNSNNQLQISCSNYVDPTDVDDFTVFMSELKSMTVDEITTRRNKQMIEEALTDDGNGSLGLLELAIFTNNTFNYTFQKMPNKQYLYTIEIKLKSNG